MLILMTNGQHQPCNVMDTFPMLTGYYIERGLYPSSSPSESEQDGGNADEGEASFSDVQIYHHDMSANSTTAALSIDIDIEDLD